MNPLKFQTSQNFHSNMWEENLSERKDWYFNGKIKFISQKILQNHKEESKGSLSLKELLEKGVCSLNKWKQCYPFKKYMNLLRKYLKAKNLDHKIRIMKAIAKLENIFLILKDIKRKSKVKKKWAKRIISCQKSKLRKARTGLRQSMNSFNLSG